MSLNLYIESDPCECCGRRGESFDANITHNLSAMADALGVYGVLWRPQENGIECADQLIDPCRKALSVLHQRPDECKKYESPNGWGTVDGMARFLAKVLQAAINNPEGRVRACT